MQKSLDAQFYNMKQISLPLNRIKNHKLRFKPLTKTHNQLKKKEDEIKN